MKMGNAFAGVGSVVDYDPDNLFFQPLPPGDCRRREQQMTEQHGVFSAASPRRGTTVFGMIKTCTGAFGLMSRMATHWLSS